MINKDEYIIPVPLSEYVEQMEDWELVEEIRNQIS